MNNDIDLKALKREAIDLLEQSPWGRKYPDLIAKMREIPIYFNSRMRTVGGRCRGWRNPATKHINRVEIDICRDFALNRATIDVVMNTVKHELAHAFQFFKNHSSGHDWEWKSIHAAMGGSAERCHEVEVKKNRVQRHVIKDLSTGKIYRAISTRTWNRIKNAKFFDVREGKSTQAYALLGVYYKGDTPPVFT